MLKKLFVVAVSLVLGLVAVVAVLWVWNAPPVVPAISQAEAQHPSKPYIVKMHAQWCSICLSTKDVWSQIAETYATRANLVVFDFTSDRTTNVSRIEAKRLGLDQFFADNEGWSGAVVVLDARTKAELAAISGSVSFDDYRGAIDKALGDVR
jgi:thiol-disulfide isomerase/thioredoxin